MPCDVSDMYMKLFISLARSTLISVIMHLEIVDTMQLNMLPFNTLKFD